MLSFSAEGYELVFVPSLPMGWKGKIVPGGSCQSYEGELGRIVIQEYRGYHWCIRYTVIQVIKKLVVGWKEEGWLRFQFLQQGKLRYQGENKKFRIHPGSVNMVFAPGRESFASFSKGKEYILFHTLYAPELVRELMPAFPAGILDEKSTIPTEMEWADTIRKILDAPYDEATLCFFFENRVRDILLFLLLRPGSGLRFEGVTEFEVEKVHEADALILKDLQEWAHIPALARFVGLSEFKLKIAFKKVMGVGMFERLRLARLEKGKQLLLDTDIQIKVIFREVGYASLSGFEEAFKEKYGLPPLQFRKKYQPKEGTN